MDCTVVYAFIPNSSLTERYVDFPGLTSDTIARIARVAIPSDWFARVDDGFDIPDIGHVAATRLNQPPGGGFSITPASVLGAEQPFTDATAIRSTVGNSRQADAYRLGRVFTATASTSSRDNASSPNAASRASPSRRAAVVSQVRGNRARRSSCAPSARAYSKYMNH
jgi:hypothetical protein